MQIKNRQQFLIALTIGVAALYVAVNFIYTPLASWWAVRAAEVRDLREKVGEGRQLVKRETFIRDQWARMQTNALPANTSLAEQQILHSFDDWSRDSGAEITSLMPQWKIDATNYLTLDLRVEASGDLGMLSKFLYDLESSPAPLRVDAVELGAHDNGGQQLTLGLEINGLALLPAPKP
jgi:Tfp pilus assembly protein PilO